MNEPSKPPASETPGEPDGGKPVPAGNWLAIPIPPRWRRPVAWAAVAGCVLVAAIILRPILTTLMSAIAVAYFVSPAIDALERRRIPRAASVLLLLVGAAGLLVGALVILVPIVGHQIADVTSNVPAYRDNISAFVENHLRPWLLQHTGYHLPPTVEAFWRQNADRLSSFAPDVAKRAWDLATATVQNVFSLLRIFINLVLFPVFLFYILKDFPKLRAGIVASIPHRLRAPAAARLKEVDQVLAGFVRGQIAVALVLCVVYSIGLSIIGIELSLVIGIAAGLLFVIPYVGYALGVLTAGGMAVARFGFDMHVVWVLLLFVAAAAFEGNVVTPKLVGERVGLHPVVMITAVIIGGEMFGFLGVLLAIPVTAAAAVFWRAEWARYKRSEFYVSAE